MQISVNDGSFTERAILAHEPENPTIREVRKQIRIELAAIIRSEKERDCVIRDESAIYGIGCLQKALRLLPTKEV